MLELKHISKAFPGVKALTDVSIRFQAGEVHALLGENGAGKSTLIKIISGLYQPDEGEIWYNRTPLRLQHFWDGIARGISVVNQEIQVIPLSSIAENVMLDKMVTFGRTGLIDWKKSNRIAGKYLQRVGINYPPATTIGGLSAAEKQLVQVAKALASRAKILLLDEPTSSISEHEVDNLFTILEELKKRGVLIIFVTHKIEEVFRICDRITVLRDGRCVGTEEASRLEKSRVIEMMIGREKGDAESFGRLEVDWERKVLEARGIHRAGTAHDISFSLFRGEVLGFYGLVGSGRSELAKILIGETKKERGELWLYQKRTPIRSVADCLYTHNMGYVTENRKEEGLILDATVKTNIALTIWQRILNRFSRFINRKKETQLTGRMVRELAVKITGLDQITRNLSGGNQQKVSIAKWLIAGCDILIIDEPTVGIDVGAKDYIHRLIWELAQVKKKSIILISSDMPEIIRLANRILVFREKRIVGEVKEVAGRNYDEVSKEIGRYFI